MLNLTFFVSLKCQHVFSSISISVACKKVNPKLQISQIYVGMNDTMYAWHFFEVDLLLTDREVTSFARVLQEPLLIVLLPILTAKTALPVSSSFLDSINYFSLLCKKCRKKKLLRGQYDILVRSCSLRYKQETISLELV